MANPPCTCTCHEIAELLQAHVKTGDDAIITARISGADLIAVDMFLKRFHSPALLGHWLALKLNTQMGRWANIIRDRCIKRGLILDDTTVPDPTRRH